MAPTEAAKEPIVAAASQKASATEVVLCGARTRSGGTCRKPAGAGTDHAGQGQCKLHGGSTANGKKHAARLLGEQLGARLQLAPHDALLDALYRQATLVAYYHSKVAALQESELVVEHHRERIDADGGFVETSSQADLHLWMRVYEQAVGQQAKLAKAAVDAGVAERHVRVVEQHAEQIARLLDGVLGDLDLTPAQLKKATVAVPKHLRLIEGGAQAA